MHVNRRNENARQQRLSKRSARKQKYFISKQKQNTINLFTYRRSSYSGIILYSLFDHLRNHIDTSISIRRITMLVARNLITFSNRYANKLINNDIIEPQTGFYS